ncbi:SRPBCC family protein [Agromyces sp. NPDC058136]|uniref:SRPBCC family protein n=1 Tax=Agromyces sp. NPDC058136 TaxID=3346354 RepID=UPI0036DB6E6A
MLAMSPAEAFDRSLDIDEHLASMSHTSERAVGGVTAGTIGLGEEVTWRARHFGLVWRMTSRITELERPSRFVDEQVRGPFHAFRHVHCFEPAGDRATLMIDEVAFSAPFGPVGRLAELVLAPYLQGLIERRNRHLAALGEV